MQQCKDCGHFEYKTTTDKAGTLVHMDAVCHRILNRPTPLYIYVEPNTPACEQFQWVQKVVDKKTGEVQKFTSSWASGQLEVRRKR